MITTAIAQTVVILCSFSLGWLLAWNRGCRYGYILGLNWVRHEVERIKKARGEA